MQNFNRRDWIRLAGMSSLLTLGNGLTAFAESPAKSVQDVENWIRLSSNENPFAPSDAVRDAMKESFDLACRYPNRHWKNLIRLIAEKEGVGEENIVVSAGSREGLQITGLLYGDQGGELLTAAPTYKAMTTYAERWGAYINSVPLNDQLEYDLPALERRLHSNTRLVFVCNPNNPTGTILDPTALEKFCNKASERTMVFVDEAYYDYVTKPGYPSMVKLVKQGKNVIVSRTFSKVYGLAGVRIGYLIARKDIAQRLQSRIVGGLNTMAVYGGIAALKDDSFKEYSLKKNAEAREYVYDLCDKMGLRYVQSHANFVFFHSGKDIQELSAFFRKKGMIIGRPFPPLTDWCRISTGKMEHMEKFGAILKEALV